MGIEVVEGQAQDWKKPGVHVVLVRPQIPQNTGSIARLCAGTASHLHLGGELGFLLEDRYLKRAGLDYWPGVVLHRWRDEGLLMASLPRERTHCFGARSMRLYTEASLGGDSVLVFGSEPTGLGDAWYQGWSDRMVRLPTTRAVRSLNLAQCAAVGVFECLRRSGWSGEVGP